MDYIARLDDKDPQGCDGECQGCDHATWMKCHEVEVHAVQFEEVFDDSDYSI